MHPSYYRMLLLFFMLWGLQSSFAHECTVSREGTVDPINGLCGTLNVQCPPNFAPTKKALVLYGHTVYDKDPFDTYLEDANIGFFYRHGLIPPNTATQLYTGVDFILMRPRSGLDTPKIVHQRGNVKFVHLPMGPCDLCGYSRVIDMIGPEQIEETYGAIFMFNSGVRGPFVTPDGGAWVDILTLLQPDQQKNVLTVTLSFEGQFHPQSYFLFTPWKAMKEIFYPMYKKSCNGTKIECILNAEMGPGKVLINSGFSIHSVGQNVTIHSEKEIAERLKVQGGGNPTFKWLDPCQTIFIKFGGDVWRVRVIPKEVVLAIQRASLNQDEMLAVNGVTRDVNAFEGCDADNGCDW